MESQSSSSPVLPFTSKLFSCCLICLEFLQLVLHASFLVIVALFRQIVPAPQKSVRGEVVLITGGGHGLGKALAFNFATLGAKVVLWDINQDTNKAVANAIRQKGGVAYAYECDVSDEKQVEEIGMKVRREVGDVTILVNNAGVLPGKPIMYLNSYQIKRTLEINTLAHFWTIRQFLPRMLELGHGHIVAISSVAGILGCANLTDYCASKFGVVGLMAALYEDLHSQGKEDCVQLTVACPSVMDTGMVQRPRSRFPTLFPLLKVEVAAQIIADGVLRNERMIVIPSRLHVIYKISNLFPQKVPLLLQHFFDYTMEPNLQ